MGKFSRNREYTFVSMEELISSVIEEFDDGADINIVITWEDFSKYLTALISTGKFSPYSIEFCYPDMNGYSYEYLISINHFENNALFVEPIYNIEHDRYNTFYDDSVDITFASANILKECYDKIIDGGCYTILFDIDN